MSTKHIWGCKINWKAGKNQPRIIGAIKNV